VVQRAGIFQSPLFSKEERAHYADEILIFRGKICTLMADISFFSDVVDA